MQTQDLPCQHRGASRGSDLFVCAIHSLCSLDRTHSRVRPCVSCSDRRVGLHRNQTGLCVHRGAEIDRRSCPSCGGAVVIKIFACAVSSVTQCQIAPKLADVHACQDCPFFEGLS